MKDSPFAILDAPLCLAVLALAVSGYAAGQPAGLSPQLQVNPAEVTFERPGDGATVWVFLDGKPVPRDAMQVAIAGSYGWMFEILPATEESGLIRVQTHEHTSEYGTYALVVRAGGQERRVLLRVGTPESFAEAQREHQTPISPCRLEMPGEFREGQAISVESPLKMDRYWFRWMLNNEVVAEGVGESRFYYVLNDPGDIRVTLVIMDEGRELARCSAAARVMPHPPVPMAAKPGQSCRFESPAGYRAIQWLLEGEPVGNGATFTHKFSRPGEYRVECLASDPSAPGTAPFYRVTYAVTVR